MKKTVFFSELPSNPSKARPATLWATGTAVVWLITRHTIRYGCFVIIKNLVAGIARFVYSWNKQRRRSYLDQQVKSSTTAAQVRENH